MNQTTALRSDVLHNFSSQIRQRDNVPGSTLVTMSTGGVVKLLLEPHTLEAMVEACGFFHRIGQPFRILGGGSNVLIPDAGVQDPVLRLGRDLAKWFVGRGFFDTEQSQSVCGEYAERKSIVVFGGMPLMTLSRQVGQAGLAGLEFAAGIPATVGGAIAMNAGAHGQDIGALVSRCLILQPGGNIVERAHAELEFSYRHSTLAFGEVILAAVLELTVDNPEHIARRRAECLEFRKKTQPLQLPSFGSVFRNPSASSLADNTRERAPEQWAAAELLEKAGLKGKQEGGVGYSALHANWIVKLNNDASTANVLSLIRKGQERVAQRYGVSLRPEVVIW